MADLEAQVRELWEHRVDRSVRPEAVAASSTPRSSLLDRGEARVAELGPTANRLFTMAQAGGTPAVPGVVPVGQEAGPFEYLDNYR